MPKKSRSKECDAQLSLESKLPQANCSSCSLRNEPLVPPSGDGRDYIFIVGEAPGATEAKRGQPFVGEAGRLLKVILVKMGLDLGRIYYTNSVMCRPPGNRDPTSKEVSCCRNRLFREINEVQPRIIMPLGAFGHLAVGKHKEAITKARGRPKYISILGADYLTISSIHPAALLRDPDGFPSLCFDLETALSIYNGAEVTIQPPIDDYYIISLGEDAKMEAFLKRLEDIDEMSLDLETTSLKFLTGEIVTCAVSWEEGTAVSFDWDILRRNKSYRERFAKAIARIKCTFHNGMFDVPWLREEGMNPIYDSDTMLSSYVLDERRGVHGLERLAITRYKAPSYKFTEEQISNAATAIPRRDLLTYNATDGDYTQRLAVDLRNEMDKKDIGVLDNLLMPAVRHFTEFFITGMLVDQDHLESNGKRWLKEIEEIEEELRSFSGAADINPNAPLQVASYLYDHLKLRQMAAGDAGTIRPSTVLEEILDVEDPEAQDYWRTQSSHAIKKMSPRTTNTYMLYWLSQQHEYPRLMVRHRILSKRYGTYYKGLKASMWMVDGRMRPWINLHGTVTSRQSSSDPNIHGTPRRDDIKGTYIADEGFYILYGDYPQAEIRMMAHFSGDKALMRLLEEEDIHETTIGKLFGLTPEQIKGLSEEDYEIKRRAAKTIRFGIQYLRAAESLSVQLGISVEEAQSYLDQIFRHEPDVLKWIMWQKHIVARDQEVESLYHNKRRFPLIANRRQKAETERQGVNMPVQASVSQMTTRAYLKTYSKLEKAGMRVMRWPQIHDAFMILVEDSDVLAAAEIMKDTMENDLDFETEVPFGPVEIKYGRSWSNLKAL